jgi:hypothetical protein
LEVDDDYGLLVADDNSTVSSSSPFELNEDTLASLPGEGRIVHHSVEQRVHVELMMMLERAEAPDYLFQGIIEWASKASMLNYNFRPRLTTRNSVLNDLQRHFGLSGLRPSVVPVKLESVAELSHVVHFDFAKQVLSLLTDMSLMQPDNLVLNEANVQADGSLDVSPWYLPYEGTGKPVDEVLSGRWYRDTVALHKRNNIFTCPIIMYVDKTFIDPMRS